MPEDKPRNGYVMDTARFIDIWNKVQKDPTLYGEDFVTLCEEEFDKDQPSDALWKKYYGKTPKPKCDWAKIKNKMGAYRTGARKAGKPLPKMRTIYLKERKKAAPSIDYDKFNAILVDADKQGTAIAKLQKEKE